MDGTWDGVMDGRGSDAVETATEIRNRDWRRRGVTALALCGALLGFAAATPAAADEYRFELRARPHAPAALPPLPTAAEFPVQLVLDDDGAEGAFGVLGGQTARQFLWFNRFGPVPTFHLDEVWVLFPIDAPPGGAVQIVVFEDGDADPTTGATLLLAFDATVQVADGNTFSIYPLPAPVLAASGNDLLIGVVPRFIVSGQTPPLLPAALDSTASAGRSWFATWVADPPDPPSLPSDQTLQPVDGIQPGNWMIRGFGTRPSAVEIPALADWGVGALVGLLALVGFVLLRRRRAAMLLLPLVLLASSAGAQTTIDLFTTNQTTLSAPPDASSTATGGADILGTRRGLVVKNLLGAGPTSAGAVGGALSLAVTATTPDSRGEARLSWDGDTNPTVLDPVGLGGVNLVGSFARGFRIRVNATSVAGVELELAVHTDGANASRAARLLPLIGSATDVLIPFSEFRVASGAGADFSDVGALELTVRGRELTVVIDEITTSLPAVAATKVDAQILDVDTDTRVDPGDRVRYTVTITNPGNDAVDVALADTVDSNATLVSGSTSSTPIARNDQYGWFGNVTLAADGSPFPTLLANDDDPDGDTVTVQAGTFPATTAQGGAVALVNAATGEFSYSPPAGFAGVDSFSYTIVDDDALTSTATAYVSLAGVVWFVDDSNTTPPFNGTQADPFQTLASLMGADPDLPGDTIFVYDDDGTPYAGGLVLEAEQKLIGEAFGLVLSGTTIVPVGGTPQITNAGGVGLTLATDNTIRGLDVTATSGAGIFGATFGTLTTSNLNVTATGGSALDLATGTLAATVGTLSSTGAGGQRGIRLQTVTGNLTATTTTLTNPTTQGIGVSSSPGVVLDFGNTTITDNAIGAAPQATAIDLATGNAGASFTFDSLAVTADGVGLLASASGTVNIAGSGNTIAATGGAAVDITSTSLGSGATFSTVTSTNSSAKGINLNTVTGALTMNGGSLTGSGTIAFDLNAGSASVTYAGSITHTSNNAMIEITSRTGGTTTLSGNLSGTGSSDGIRVASNSGGTVNFSGSTKTLTTGADIAVSLTTNGGSTINFTGGGLAITTTSGTGFNATGGATAITVQGSGNTITSTTGTALNVSNTTIGAGNLVLQSISAGTVANVPLNGIVLDTTGSAGRLQVTGTGSAGSGGTIQRASGPGVLLTSTSNVSLSFMNILNGTDDGIRGQTVNGLDLIGCAITGNGDSTSDDGLALGAPSGSVVGITGTLNITNTNISGNAHNGVHIRNTSGTLDAMNVTGSTFNDVNDTFGANAFLFETSGTAVTTAASISSSSFLNNTPQRALEVQAHDTGRIGNTAGPVSYFVVSGSVFTNNGIHASFTQDGSANLAFKMLNNGTLASPMTGTVLQAINVFSSSQATGGTIVGVISGNHINNGAVNASGISAVIQGQTDATLLIDANRIRSTPDSRGLAVAFRGPANPLAGTLGPNTVVSDLTLTNNDIDTGPAPSGFPLCAIVVEADNQTLADNKSPTVRADIRANIVPSSTCFDLLSTQITYYEYDGAGSHGIGQLVDTAPASADATAQLVSTNTGSASAFGVALIAGPINTPP